MSKKYVTKLLPVSLFVIFHASPWAAAEDLTGRVAARIQRSLPGAGDSQIKAADFPNPVEGGNSYVTGQLGAGDSDVAHYYAAIKPDEVKMVCNATTVPLLLVYWEVPSNGGSLTSASSLPTTQNAVTWGTATMTTDNVSKVSKVDLQHERSAAVLSDAVQGVVRNAGLAKGFNLPSAASTPKSDLYVGLAVCETAPVRPAAQIPTLGQIGSSFENLTTQLETVIGGILSEPGNPVPKFSKMNVNVKADSIEVVVAPSGSIDNSSHALISAAVNVLKLVEPEAAEPPLTAAAYRSAIRDQNSGLASQLDALIMAFNSKSETSEIPGLFNGKFFWELAFSLNSAARDLGTIDSAWNLIETPVASGGSFDANLKALAQPLIVAGIVDAAEMDIHNHHSNLRQGPGCLAQSVSYVTKVMSFLPYPLLPPAGQKTMNINTTMPEGNYAIGAYLNYYTSPPETGNLKLIFGIDTPDQLGLSLTRTRGTQLLVPDALIAEERNFHFVLRAVGCPPPALNYCKLDTKTPNSCRVAQWMRTNRNSCPY